MCKRLREITQSLALRPCLFRIKPKVVGVAEHTFKQHGIKQYLDSIRRADASVAESQTCACGRQQLRAVAEGGDGLVAGLLPGLDVDIGDAPVEAGRGGGVRVSVTFPL